IYARKTLINAYFIRQGGAILQKLARAARHVHIAELDCRTRDGLRKTVRYRGLEVWRPLADSIVGRASCASLTHPLTGATVVNDGDIISLEQAQQLEALGIDSWVVRSPVTCRSKAGICAKCYGADLSTDTLVRPGARVGIIAAQTLGDALSRFHPIISVRTFHTGAIAYSVSAFHAGTITYHNLRIAEVPDDGKTIRRVLSRDAVVVISDQGREVQREKIPYGATLLVSEGDLVRPFQRLAESSPWITSLYAETAGTVSLENIDPSTSEIDRESLTPRLKISDHDGRRRPLVRILDPATGTPLSFHFLPIGARLHVSHGQSVIPGQPIAACMHPSGYRDFDTATGIPRVIELLEAQNPRDHAILAEASGIVEVIAEPGTYRNMEVRVKDSDSVSFQHRIPIASILRVHSGDYVRKGDALIGGPASPHDLLRLRGTKGLCDYMLTEFADAFGIQSLEVDEKHLEIILRQMLQQPGVVQPLSKISRHRDVGTYPDPLN
ncbi:MAG TPA: hypothetical protein VHM90_00420, partial [Phycisphaerae bacterium]|nr:hypothetical protein [Phycisphaerae bacterium]